MSNANKRKGYDWEKLVEDLMNKHTPFSWKRIPGSGAFGSVMNIVELQGDLIGRYDFFPFRFRGEAKVGYGGTKQITVKREWFNKIREESEKNWNDLPCVLLKYSGSKAPNAQHIIAFEFDVWFKILDYVKDLFDENIKLRDKLHTLEGK